MQNLSEGAVEQIVQYLDSFLQNETVCPSYAGKSSFLNTAIERPDFLPETIREQIKEHSGGMPQKDYLLSHQPIREHFQDYWH